MSDSPRYLIPQTKEKHRTELLADYWRQRWLLKRIEKPGSSTKWPVTRASTLSATVPKLNSPADGEEQLDLCVRGGGRGYHFGGPRFANFRPAFPSSAIISERSSPSRVRCAAPNNGAPLTAPGRSDNTVWSRGKGSCRTAYSRGHSPPKWYPFLPPPTPLGSPEFPNSFFAAFRAQRSAGNSPFPLHPCWSTAVKAARSAPPKHRLSAKENPEQVAPHITTAHRILAAGGAASWLRRFRRPSGLRYRYAFMHDKLIVVDGETVSEDGVAVHWIGRAGGFRKLRTRRQ